MGVSVTAVRHPATPACKESAAQCTRTPALRRSVASASSQALHCRCLGACRSTKGSVGCYSCWGKHVIDIPSATLATTALQPQRPSAVWNARTVRGHCSLTSCTVNRRPVATSSCVPDMLPPASCSVHVGCAERSVPWAPQFTIVPLTAITIYHQIMRFHFDDSMRHPKSTATINNKQQPNASQHRPVDSQRAAAVWSHLQQIRAAQVDCAYTCVELAERPPTRGVASHGRHQNHSRSLVRL